MATQIHPVQLQYSHTIGRAEFSGPGFRVPVGIACGEGDRLYVLSRSYEGRPDGKRVTVCTVREEYISEFGRGIRAEEADGVVPDGYFMWPTSIALDQAGNVYVADEWLHRISIFSKDGDWIGKWGTAGVGVGELNRPSGLAFDKDDHLYIVDSLNNRIQQFTKDGQCILRWGKPGSAAGEFNMPWGIAIDTEGDVYVTDWRNDRLQVFDNDGNFINKLTGEATVSKWGKEKLDANAEMWQQRQRAQGLEREKQFWGPLAVAVDDEGRIFVGESARSRIQVYRKQIPTFIGDRL